MSRNLNSALIRNYKSLIKNCISKSLKECKTDLNIGQLNNLLDQVYNSAESEGIDTTIIDNLINDCMPIFEKEAA